MSFQGLAAVWGGKAGSSKRRPATSPSPSCESLEGRQLLSMAGLSRGNLMAMSSQRAQAAQFYAGGASTPGNGGAFQRGNFGSVNAARAGQGGGLGHRLQMGGAGIGLGAQGTKGALRLARLQNVGGTPVATPVNTMMVTPNGSSQFATTTLTANPDPAGTPAISTVDGQPVTTLPATGDFTTVTPGDLAAKSFIAKDFKLAPANDEVSKAFEKLNTDVQTIQDKSEVTPKQLAAVRNDVKAINDATTSEASEDSLKTFTADVQSLDGKLPTDAQRDQLIAEFTAVVKSQGITDQAVIDKTVADIQAVAQSTHITSDDLALIAADRKAIDTAMGVNTDTTSTDTTTDAGSTSDATDAKVFRFGPIGEPTQLLLAGLTGGNITGVPVGGGMFTLAASGVPFGGPMGGGPTDGGPFTVSMSKAAFDGPMDAPFGGPMGGGQFTVGTKGGKWTNWRANNGQPVGAMGGGQFTVSMNQAPGGGPVGFAPAANVVYGGSMGRGPIGGPWGY